MKRTYSILKKLLLQPPSYKLGNTFAGKFATIFMLHRSKQFTPSRQGTDPELLRRCLEFSIKNGFRFASIDELVDAAMRGETLTRPTLCFTLDDGYKDQSDILIPILLDYGAKPTLFVIKDFISKASWPWDAKLTYLLADSSPENCRLMISGNSISIDTQSAESRISSRRLITRLFKQMPPNEVSRHLEELASALKKDIPNNAPDEFRSASWSALNKQCKRGLHIGSHGSGHNPLSQLDESHIRLSLQETRQYILENAAQASNVFCYPSGTAMDFSEKHYNAIRAAGHSGALSAQAGNVKLKHIAASPFNIPRHAFPGTFDEFVQHTSWIEYCRTKRP